MMGIIGMADGAESLNLSLVLPIMEDIWGIEDWQESLLGSLVFTGYFLGALFSGEFANKYGRKRPLLAATILIFIVAGSKIIPIFLRFRVFNRLLHVPVFEIIFRHSCRLCGSNNFHYFGRKYTFKTKRKHAGACWYLLYYGRASSVLYRSFDAQKFEIRKLETALSTQ